MCGLDVVRDGQALSAERSSEKMKIGTQMLNFPNITVNPLQMGGVPCIRGLRVPVATVLRMLAAGMTERQILDEYPDLEAADIRECLRYAAAVTLERELPLPQSV